MGRIQSNVGLITGINIEDTVNKLMQLNAIPKTRLEDRNKLLDQERTAVTQLMTLVVGVQLTTDQLGQQALFDSVQISSSDPTQLTARKTGTPAEGTYNFTPVRLAQTQQLASLTFSSENQKLAGGEIKIHTGGFLDRPVYLDALNGGAGVSRGLISIQDRSGATETIDLRFAQTVQDVVDAINSADGIKVTASIEGGRLKLTDTSGGTAANLEVNEVGSGTTAADLGLAGISIAATSATGSVIYKLAEAMALSQLRDQRGLNLPTSGDALAFQLHDGTSFSVQLDLDPNSASLGELFSAIESASNGKVDVRIAADGQRIEIADLTSGAQQFTISSPSGDLAAQLGLDNAEVGGVITGDRLLAGLDDALLSSLRGGNGTGQLGRIAITDRSGATATIDLSTTETIGEVIGQINAAGIGVTARLNRTRTGIEIVDTTGATNSNLIVADADATNSATKLQIKASVAKDAVDSGSLNLQFVTRNTLLSDYNQGRGVSLGSIKITDANGKSATLNLANRNPKTIGDVIDALNNLGLAIEAKINDTGDGILVVNTAANAGTLTINDVGGGQTAAQLRIAGSETTVLNGGVSAQGIDGSGTIRISTSSSTTVADLVDSLNQVTNGPVRASLINAGGSSGVRILLTSSASGRAGRVAVDGGGVLDFTQTAAAQDALVAYGASSGSGGVLVTSSSNTFENIVEGLSVDIADASQSNVTVTVTKSDERVIDSINKFVEQYNKLRDKYDELTAYNSETNETGVLFARGSALRVDTAFSRLLTGQFRGAGTIQSLTQLGIRLNDQGKLEFDEAKFSERFTADPEAVKAFFTTEDSGFSDKARAVADSLAGVENGALLVRSNTLNSQIETNTDRIAAWEARLEKQRERLLKQFYSMESTIAKIQQDLTALNQLQALATVNT